MRRLAKNLILATATVSAIFIVDLSPCGAAAIHFEKNCHEKICPLETGILKQHVDFWSKFRDTVMPDEPQNNNPPKETKNPESEKKPPPKSDTKN